MILTKKLFTQCISLFLLQSSCSRVETNEGEYLKKSPYELLKEDFAKGNSLEGYEIISVQPEWISFEENLDRPEVVDCCLECTASITFNISPVDYWYLSIIATCGSDPLGYAPEEIEVASFTDVEYPWGSSATFPVIDEHHYWFLLLAGGNLNITITDIVGTYNISVPPTVIQPGTAPFVILNCDLRTYAECYAGHGRVCCLED